MAAHGGNSLAIDRPGAGGAPGARRPPRRAVPATGLAASGRWRQRRRGLRRADRDGRGRTSLRGPAGARGRAAQPAGARRTAPAARASSGRVAATCQGDGELPVEGSRPGVLSPGWVETGAGWPVEHRPPSGGLSRCCAVARLDAHRSHAARVSTSSRPSMIFGWSGPEDDSGVITGSCGSTISRRARRTLQVEQPTSPPGESGGEGYANVEASP